MQTNSITFSFDEVKTTQAAALLLKRAGDTMSYMALIKLLYLADREALKETDRPITGDRYYSLEYGPILSRVKNFITEEKASRPYWGQYISAPSNYAVSLQTDPGTDELCQAEEDILHQIFEEYGRLDQFKLAELTHEICDEWDKPPENGEIGPRATPIAIENILKAVGRKPSEIEEIRKNRKEERILDVLLSE